MRRPSKGAVFLALVISCVPSLLSSPALGHGENPSTCENRYDAEITSMSIDNGTRTFNPMSDSILEFSAQIDKGYDVTFTLHTANMSSQNNTSAGSVWYRTVAFGFGSGVCANDAGPDRNISLSVHVGVMPNIPDGYTQNGVEWGSWPGPSQVRYNVVWHNATEPEPPVVEPPQEQPQDNTTNEEPTQPAPNDDDEHENDDEDDTEFEDDAEGTVHSPFIFRDGTTSVSSAEPEEESVNPSLSLPPPQVADTLHINGTLVSFHYLNDVKPYILAGNWSMAINDTTVFDFKANFTMVRLDGLDQREFSLTNITAIHGSDVALANNTMSMKSQLDFVNRTAAKANATIVLYKLNTIAIHMEGMSTPIYGVVDKIVRIEGGQTTVLMTRQFDMI